MGKKDYWDVHWYSVRSSPPIGREDRENVVEQLTVTPDRKPCVKGVQVDLP
jgi:hypothetical protein